MSLLSALKSIGKDLRDVGGWIDEGIQVIGPILGAVDPPLAPIITEIETILARLFPNTPASATQLQAIVKAVATTQTLNSIPATRKIPQT
jgi:hypothetical protein